MWLSVEYLSSMSEALSSILSIAKQTKPPLFMHRSTLILYHSEPWVSQTEADAEGSLHGIITSITEVARGAGVVGEGPQSSGHGSGDVTTGGRRKEEGRF